MEKQIEFNAGDLVYIKTKEIYATAIVLTESKKRLRIVYIDESCKAILSVASINSVILVGHVAKNAEDGYLLRRSNAKYDIIITKEEN